MTSDQSNMPKLANVLKVSPDIQIDLLKKFVKHTNACAKNEDGTISRDELLVIRDEMLKDILIKVEELIKTNACSIYIKDSPTQATLRAARGYQEQKVGKAVRRIVSATNVAEKPKTEEKLGLTSWVISTGRSFLATKPEDFFNHPHWSGQLDKLLGNEIYEKNKPITALLAIPLRDSRGQIIGALKAQRSTLNDFFSVENQITLEELGQITGRCITYVDDAQSSPVNEAVTSWALKIFSDTSTAEGELDSFLDIVVRVAAAASQADACSAFLIDESKRTLTQRAGCGHQSLRKTIRSYELPNRSTLDDCYVFEACNPATCLKKSSPGLPEDKKVGITAWVAATGKSFYANSKEELRQHCHHKGQFDRENFAGSAAETENNYLEECSAWFGVPLIVGGTVIGVLKIENKTPIQVADSRQFSTEVKQQIEILAQDIAISIQKIQVQSETRYEVIKKAMPTILTILQGGLDIPVLVARVVDETAKLFNARACALFLREGEKLIQPEWAAVGYAATKSSKDKVGYRLREYTLVAPEVIQKNPAPKNKEDKVGLTVWIAVTQQKFSARSNQELKLHPHHRGTYDEKNFAEEEKCESFMGVPMLVGEENQKELIGVLKVETKQKQNGERIDYSYFNEQDALVFELISNSAAIAIQNARLLASKRLADRLLSQPNRYSTLSVIFDFIEQRIDVINTLEGAAKNVRETDARKDSIVRSITGVLSPDFNNVLLRQIAHQISDSKDSNCGALTNLFNIMADALNMKSWSEIYKVEMSARTVPGLFNPQFVLYNCAQILLNTHKEIAQYLQRYSKDKYQIVDLKNCIDLLQEKRKVVKMLNLFERNVLDRIFEYWELIIQKEFSSQHNIKNPYIAGMPLNPESAVFFGREEVFRWIEDNLHGQKVVLIIHGGWHTGKTSILKQIEAGPFGEQIRERISALPVFIDLQELPDSGIGAFLLNLADRINTVIRPDEISLSDEEEASFMSMPYRAFDKFLQGVGKD
jgi:GAF domain-containing protein